MFERNLISILADYPACNCLGVETLFWPLCFVIRIKTYIMKTVLTVIKVTFISYPCIVCRFPLVSYACWTWTWMFSQIHLAQLVCTFSELTRWLWTNHSTHVQLTFKPTGETALNYLRCMTLTRSGSYCAWCHHIFYNKKPLIHICLSMVHLLCELCVSPTFFDWFYT